MVVKGLKVLHASREAVLQQKLSFLLLSIQAVLADSRPVLINNPESSQSETSGNASESETTTTTLLSCSRNS